MRAAGQIESLEAAVVGALWSLGMGVYEMGFELYPLDVGAGRLALSSMPGHFRSLPRDLKAIEDWGPTLVISLVEAAEVRALGISGFDGAMQAAAFQWIQFPIRDFRTPKRAQEPQWEGVCAQAVEILNAGGRVLVHCRGGCGRSGMVALRLMVASGLRLGESLSELRHVRPCAVETDAQMIWASEGRILKA